MQIWDLASSGSPKLGQAQFTNALRLVSLAQVRARVGGVRVHARARVHRCACKQACPTTPCAS